MGGERRGGPGGSDTLDPFRSSLPLQTPGLFHTETACQEKPRQPCGRLDGAVVVGSILKWDTGKQKMFKTKGRIISQHWRSLVLQL